MLTIKKIIKYKLWVSSTIAIVVALVIIPTGLLFVETPEIPKYNNDYYKSRTIFVPEGIHIKNADPVFYDFLNDVKKTNGIIVLGSSETSNWLGGKNYYTLLSMDKMFDRTVYQISGAGRLANMYFPLILNNPEPFNDLEIIYYINPTYWRKDLCEFNEEYFERYVDFSIVQKTKSLAKEKGVYHDFLKLSPANYISGFSNKLVADYRSLFVEKINALMDPQSVVYNDVMVSKQQPSLNNKIDIKSYYTSEELEDERNKINLEYNVTNEYLSKNEPFPEMDTSLRFQYDLLTAFIDLCKENNIKIVFYLGPFNEVYCRKINPEYLGAYQQTISNIRELLILNEANFIDGSSLSNITGTFIDKHHISEYGAYLTALQIKEYYEKDD